jgi:hypothetical protein
MRRTGTTILVGAAIGICVVSTADAAVSVLGAPVTAGVVGDANGDGITNFSDFQLLERNFGKAGGLAQGDFSGNGQIDPADLTLLSNNMDRRRTPVFYGKIADTSTAVPNSTGTFKQLNTPVIDGTGNVAFLGIGGSTYGVYRWNNTVSRVADTTTLIPNGTGAFINFGQPSVATGQLAFQGVGENNQEGIYNFNFSNSQLTRIVNKTTVRPEGGTFSSFGDPAVFTTSMAFVGQGSGQSGAYSVANSQVTSVVNSNTPIPNGTGNFTSFDNTVSDGSSYFFIGRGVAQMGIFKRSAGVISPVLTNTTQVPGTSNRFTGLGNLSIDGSNMAFNGIFGGVPGVYGLFGGEIKYIADKHTPVPGGKGTFYSFGAPSVGGSGVAFLAYDGSQRPGVYAWVDGELVRVVDTSTMLDGKRVTALAISKDAVISNKVMFQATFADGTMGIYAATLPRTDVAGDVNGDGRVNSSDFYIVQQNMGLAGSRSSGDLNGDFKVNFADFQVLERFFGKLGVAPLKGDADGDGKVDASDVSIVNANLNKYGTRVQGDFTGDGRISQEDLAIVNAALGAGTGTLKGDINGDRVVDGADFSVLFANFGKNGTLAQGDFTGDGKINFADFQILERQFGTVWPGTFEPFGGTLAAADAPFAAFSEVPEPGIGLLAGVGLMLLGRRRRATQA